MGLTVLIFSLVWLFLFTCAMAATSLQHRNLKPNLKESFWLATVPTVVMFLFWII